jgi:hypothetical protein
MNEWITSKISRPICLRDELDLGENKWIRQTKKENCDRGQFGQFMDQKQAVVHSSSYDWTDVHW